MVDHQVRRDHRVDLFRVAAEAGHRVAHRRQIHQRRHSGKVLKQYPRRDERYLAILRSGRAPRSQRPHVVFGDGEPIHVAQNTFEQHLDAHRQPVDIPHAGVRQRPEPEELQLPLRRGQRRSGSERVTYTSSSSSHAHPRFFALEAYGNDPIRTIRTRPGGVKNHVGSATRTILE